MGAVRPKHYKSVRPRKAAFLAALAQCGNVTEAARKTGIARMCHYDWLKRDPDYVKATEVAVEESIQHLEQVARKRAVTGSDLLLIFLLKAHRPEKYREQHRHEITGANGAPIAVTFGGRYKPPDASGGPA